MNNSRDTLLEKSISRFYNTLSAHHLVEVLNSNDYRIFTLFEDGLNLYMGSITIIFTPKNIIITGDYCPSGYACGSNIGYGLSWFVNRLDPEYLASKFGFNKNGFSEDVFKEDFSDYVASLEEYLENKSLGYESEKENLQHLKYILENIDQYDDIEFEVRTHMDSDDFYGAEFGYYYDINAVALLSAIQTKFSKEYK